jgi:hypothetical protein
MTPESTCGRKATVRITRKLSEVLFSSMANPMPAALAARVTAPAMTMVKLRLLTSASSWIMSR